MYRNHRVIGILAHVDAGKTTLAEGILYTSGAIREMGRVDHQDAFLDHFALERERGITIFSKQAVFEWNEMQVTLLDTPGHVDFSAEMERTLQVLDYAVLVISGADGVQGHTLTLWNLLRRYEVPVFLFVNKMDQDGTDEEKILRQLQEKLDVSCLKFCGYHPEEREQAVIIPETDPEEISLCSEQMVEEYLQSGELSAGSIADAVSDRKLFPVYFGSALRMKGVRELLEGLSAYTLSPEYPEEFGARVFKISRDKQGNRLTHLKVTGGILRAKQMLVADDSSGEDVQEKADQLRVYNGTQFRTVQEIPAGGICAVAGPVRTYIGQGLGAEEESTIPSLEPILTYGLKLPEGSDPSSVLSQLRRLEEEEPLLHVTWKEQVQEIHVQVMGEVQIEILKRVLRERFDLEAEFENGSIVYKETLAEPVLGVGHFEPLRHYAEVQLLLEPGEPGSGLIFQSYVSEDDLDKNWQRLILTHLEERSHPGVLIGSEVTDLRISLVAGKSHLKHTEGGDFRQATYRALRQGLRSGKSILLEPVLSFVLEVPTEYIGRAMTDIQRMQGSFDAPLMEGDNSILRGSVPAAGMREYQREVLSYSRGLGRLSYVLKGYEPCKEPEAVIRERQYDPEGDVPNPTGSVFCAHGAGFVVPWNEVYEYAHLPLRTDFLEAAFRWQSGMGEQERSEGSVSSEQLCRILPVGEGKKRASGAVYGQTGGAGENLNFISQEEIEAIFAQGRKNQNKKENDRRGYRRYHRGARRPEGSQGDSASGQRSKRTGQPKKQCLLVDGYNIIFAWPELAELANQNLDAARDRLIEEMRGYQGYLGGTLILVFDAYKVKGNLGTVQKWDPIYVVYTREAETADQYIEKTVHEMASEYEITVATSDGLVQMIIWGEGAIRMSASGLWEDLERRRVQARKEYGITETDK